MAIIVEDGTGVAGANSFVSSTSAGTFFSDRGIAAPSNGYDPLLIRSMDVLMYLSYKGERANGVNGLPFPRTNISDPYGIPYADNAIPSEIITAQLWLSYYIEKGNDPTAVSGPATKRQKVDTLEIEYAVNTGDKTTVGLVGLPNVYNPLKHLLLSSSTTGASTAKRVIR